MITTVADLLLKIIAREKEVLAQQPDLNHMPMLGDMYEGLARSILSYSIFKGLGLNVVEGKIKYTDGTLSPQMDCMIVVGDGYKLPFTEHYIYSFGQVIAVVEAKKTLYGTALQDSYTHLRGINCTDYPYQIGLAKLAASGWQAITGRPYPAKDERLDKHQDMLRHVVNVYSHQPIRVILGYDGFTSEYTLRKGLYDYIMKQVSGGSPPEVGFGPGSFPHLIICKAASIIRLDGMPYTGPIEHDNFWSFLASSSCNPFRILLEILWTRFSYLYPLPNSIFGDDLELEVFHRYMDAKFTDNVTPPGWIYRCQHLSKETLESAPQWIKWEPEKLTLVEYLVINRLCVGERIDTTDSSFKKMLIEHGTDLDTLANSLTKKHLATIIDKSLILTADECVCAKIKGNYYAAENNSGRFTRWYQKHYIEKV